MCWKFGPPCGTVNRLGIAKTAYAIGSLPSEDSPGTELVLAKVNLWG